MIGSDRTSQTLAGRFLDVGQVAREFLGYTGKHPYQAVQHQIKKYGFPRGVQIGTRMQWRERDVLAWREARAERVLGGVK
jgi:predicted DNA-binding transcriptional regulator AlpA